MEGHEGYLPWDMYYLYEAGALWGEDAPPMHISSGYTIIALADELLANLLPLIEKS